LTSIAAPILDYAILAVSIIILIGLPAGLLVKRRKKFDYQILIILISLVFGTAVVIIEYVHLIEWCYGLERMPFGLAVGCNNFLPGIHFSILVGCAFSILLAYFVNQR